MTEWLLKSIKFLVLFARSSAFQLWLVFTVIPSALVVILLSWAGLKGERIYWLASFWLKAAIAAARLLAGVNYRVLGYQHLPVEKQKGVVLLVKHQSTYETFLMPAIMPHPLAYVFKKELLSIPFFGWAIAQLDMVHIDRDQKTKAFHRVVEQGRVLLDKGIWVIMFPEGTRIKRGQSGTYKSGGARLAIETSVDVIPIAVASAKCWPRKSFLIYPGTVEVSIGPPISSEGVSPQVLSQAVEDWIECEMRRIDAQAY